MKKKLHHAVNQLFFAPSARIDIESDFYSRNYPWKKFTRGNTDQMYPVNIWGWSFQGSISKQGIKIRRYFSSLIDSGIYYRLYVEILARKNIGRRPVFKREPEINSSLSGGMVTLFILCGAFLGLTALVIIVECRWAIIQWVRNLWRKMVWSLRKLRFKAKLKLKSCCLKVPVRKKRRVRASNLFKQ